MERRPIRDRLGGVRRLPLAVPGALTAMLAFRSGGFFPEAVADAALVLALVMVLLVTLPRAPLSGWSAIASIVAAAGAAFAVWVLASAAWSHAPARAVIEFDRALLYLLTFAVMAATPRRPGDMTVMLRWVLAAIVAAAAAGLATRLLPDVFSAVPGREPSRLAWPLTYWNGMGVMCALGWVLALQGASGSRQPTWMRALAAASLPLLAVAGYFPFSRGGIGVAVLGTLLYVVLARPPRLLVTVLAAGPAVAIALVSAYGADTLATAEYFRGNGPAEGHRVAVIVVACAVGAALVRLVAARLDRVADRLSRRQEARPVLVTAVVLSLLAVVVVGVAIDAPERARAEYRGFLHGNVVDPGSDTRNRLTASGNNGRLAMWRVDRSAFSAEPLHGTGAGTYALRWERERPTALQVVDGHSLYLETLGELGIVGLVLLVVVLGGILFALARGLRRGDRHGYAAACAAGLALLAHAAIDWDWEMPVLFAWFFAAGGLACARSSRGAVGAGSARLTRVVAGLACLVLAVTPFRIGASQRALDRAQDAFARGDCPASVDAALDSVGAVSQRPEPFELIGICDLRGGQAQLGLRAMASAHHRDPGSWRYAYDLALARAFTGQDPRPQAALARRLNPLDADARRFAAAVRARPRPAAWHRAATRARLPF